MPAMNGDGAVSAAHEMIQITVPTPDVVPALPPSATSTKREADASEDTLVTASLISSISRNSSQTSAATLAPLASEENSEVPPSSSTKKASFKK